MPIPSSSDLEKHGISLSQPPRVYTFELCRFLAETHRDMVLASTSERRTSVPDELDEILVLDEWCHPDIVATERPSESETFQLLATVLVSGDPRAYRPRSAPNTHWSRWPDGGTL